MAGHVHAQVPDSPLPGDTFTCPCGYTAEYVVLPSGWPGEWVQTSQD